MAEEDSSYQLLGEYENLRSQAQAYEENLQVINDRISEFQNTITSIKEMKDLEGEKETLVPLGSGAFIKTTLPKPEKITLNVGAEVYVNKSLAEAVQTLEGRVDELEKVRKEHDSSYQKIMQRLQEIAPQVQQIMASQQKQR